MESVLERLKVGRRVHCPADRGDPPYYGVVEFIDNFESTHLDKTFHWVTVRRDDGRPGGVWPSNRLSFLAESCPCPTPKQ